MMNPSRKPLIVLKTQFIVVPSLDLGMCCTFVVNIFLLELLPLIVSLLEFMFHQSSKFDLMYTCVKCTMLQDFGRMSSMHISSQTLCSINL